MRGVLLAAAAVALVVAAGAGARTAARPCGAAQLTAKVGESQGAAGTIAFSVVLRNLSSTRCTLGGFPTLQMRSAAGTVRTRVRHGGHAFLVRPVRVFTLAPGGRATLLVAYNHVPHEGETTCPTATSLWLRPPGSAGAVRVAVRMDPCNRGLVYESPLLPGVVPLP